MFNYIAFLTFGLVIVTLTTAKPLYTTAGSSQLDVRNNYNSGSGYSTSIGYASPLSTRIIAAPSTYAYSATPVARYSPALVAGPFAYGAPSAAIAARYESPVLGAGYAAPYVAQYSAPAPALSPFAAPYASAYGSPYTIAAPGSSPILF